MRSVTVFAPGSIGNVGPGFDVLGLAFDGVGDRVTLTLRDAPGISVAVSGRDAEQLPVDAARNTAAVAARAVFEQLQWSGGAEISLLKGLPLSGGMGGSAASSVAGAAAASLALRGRIDVELVVAAALEGEALVSGRHLDNILPSACGGLMLARSVDPLDFVRLHVARPWWVSLVTPQVRVETRSARSILDATVDRAIMIQLMANTASMVHAFASGDGELLRRSLDDVYAEPARKSLIPNFDAVKRAALANGSLGCSISGSGPTVFSIAPDEDVARRCAVAMSAAFGEVAATFHVSAIAIEGVRAV